MKKIIVLVFLFAAIVAKAEPSTNSPESIFAVDGKVFTTKAGAIRYVINSGKRLTVLETRCLILTNKLTFKACPKNKLNSFENAQFESLSKTN